MTPTPPQLIPTDAVAERLGCSLCTVRRMMADTARAGIAQPWILVGTRSRWSAGVRAHYLDADALGLRGVVGMVAPVGAKQAETVVPLRRAKGEA